MANAEIKFIYIFLCFLTTLVTYRGCFDKRDWKYLAGGMAFNVAADYQLLITGHVQLGVWLFMAVHLCYLLRANISFMRVFIVYMGGILCVLLLPMNGLAAAAALYAGLFIWDIVANIKQTRYLILAGLFLFALCDINVLIYNLPHYVPGTEAAAQIAYKLIWVFYTPAQALLAVSALNVESKNVSHSAYQ